MTTKRKSRFRGMIRLGSFEVNLNSVLTTLVGAICVWAFNTTMENRKLLEQTRKEQDRIQKQYAPLLPP